MSGRDATAARDREMPRVARKARATSSYTYVRIVLSEQGKKGESNATGACMLIAFVIRPTRHGPPQRYQRLIHDDGAQEIVVFLRYHDVQRTSKASHMLQCRW